MWGVRAVGIGKSLIAVLLVLVMVAGSAGTALTSYASPNSTVNPSANSNNSPSAQGVQAVDKAWMSKVDPRLLEDSFYMKKAHLPVGASLEQVLDLVKSEFVHKIPSKADGKARVIVYFTGGEKAIEAIKDVAIVTSGVRLEGAKSGYVIAYADKSEIEQLAKLPYVISVVPDTPMPIPEAKSDRMFEEQAVGGPGVEPDIYGAVNITGATYAWSLGYNGSGVKAVVVDTGIDMGESDLGNDALARDANGAPMLFDADENGLVLTMNPASYIGNGTIFIEPLQIGNYTGILYYDGYDGGLYMTNYSIVLVYDSYTGNYTVLGIPVANSTYGVPPEIGNNSIVHFGLASQNIYAGPFFIWYLAPTISVDIDGDGTFDGAYTDLSTTYFLVMYSIYLLGYAPMPDITLYDISFADESLLNYQNPIAARDFTGDGVNDFSLGAIAGAFNDANGIFGPVYSFDWLNDWEDTGYILPGYDYETGYFLDFEFDFHGHGTYCAHVIASRGEIPRPLGYGEGYYKLPGIAPGAKVGGATALWNGNVVMAELYFSGFTLVDPSTFAWAYTGDTQADVISNSWGSSYLIINGYANDADPMSLFEDFITLYTGTVIVHAAGNGGPGYGSVTMPGSATSVITAGASTEFYYRPVYGYLPGAYGQVVSWSDRGPTQFAYPKPDIVNIGSFAWSIGRVIDGLGDGLYAFDLFGGTSEATPMTAGAVAILIQALKDNGYTVTPGLVKTLLKSSAMNLGYDPFVQGSGHVDLKDAINRILQGGFIVASNAPLEVSKYFDDTMSVLLGFDKSSIQALFASDADTAAYFGVVKPGETKTETLTLERLGGYNGTPTVIPVHLVKTQTLPISSIADLSKAVLLVPSSSGPQILPVPNQYVTIIGSYLFIKANSLPSGSRLLIPANESILDQATFAQLDVYYPYFYMDPFGRQGGYDSYFMMGVEVSYWVDYNYDGLVLPWETARIQYDIREGNAFHVPLGFPSKAFEMAKEEALEYLEKYYGLNASDAYSAPVLDFRFFSNMWEGIPGNIVIPLKAQVTLYQAQPWDWVTATVNGSSIELSMSVPANADPGVYEGMLRVIDGNMTTCVPISVAVPFVVEPGVSIAKAGKASGEVYENYVFKGALDQGWRPEVGDWRVYPIVLDNYDSSIVALKVVVRWSDAASSFDAALIGPGVNYWGVGNESYLAWIDAGVVSAKISGVSRYVGASGVYTYFDYPSARATEIIAPIASPLIDPDATTYWLVVHQVFQGKNPDRINLFISPLTVIGNTLTVKAGSTNARIAGFASQDIGVSFQLDEPIVIPLTGGYPSDINVSVYPNTLPPTPYKQIMIVASSSPDAAGAYLVLVPYYSARPSVIWGFNAFGTSGILVALPTIYYVNFIVYVTP